MRVDFSGRLSRLVSVFVVRGVEFICASDGKDSCHHREASVAPTHARALDLLRLTRFASGLIGSAWAAMFARSGYTVRVSGSLSRCLAPAFRSQAPKKLFDSFPAQLPVAEKALDALLAKLEGGIGMP